MKSETKRKLGAPIANPEYFAVPDPLDPARSSYWRRPRTGRGAGKLTPWPPRRSDWGKLWIRDIPVNRRIDPAGYREFARAHFAKVREARKAVEATVTADPLTAAA